MRDPKERLAAFGLRPHHEKKTRFDSGRSPL